MHMIYGHILYDVVYVVKLMESADGYGCDWWQTDRGQLKSVTGPAVRGYVRKFNVRIEILRNRSSLPLIRN